MDKDLKDLVGISGDGSKGKKEKKKPSTVKKPDGLSRELYGLVGATTVEVPLYPADPLRGLKQKRKVKPTAAVHWELCQVPCSARPPSDSFRIWRWLSKDQFEKLQKGTYQDHLQQLNKPIRVFKYTDAEYSAHLADPKWTKELTDELFQLCERYELRWIVMHDRFSSDVFSIEDMKERYYNACATLLNARCKNDEDRQIIKQHPIMVNMYNKEQEVARKKHLDILWGRTRQEEQEELRLRQQMRIIHQVRKKKAEREQKERSTQDRKDRMLRDFLSQHAQQRGVKRPFGADEGSEPNAENSLAAKATKRLKPGVTLRSQLLFNPGNAGSQRDVDQYVERLGVRMPTQRTFELVCELREMLERYYDLKNKVKDTEEKVRKIKTERDELRRRYNCLCQTTEGLSPMPSADRLPKARAAKPQPGKGAGRLQSRPVASPTTAGGRRPQNRPRRYGRPTMYAEDDDDESDMDLDDEEEDDD